MVSLLFLATLAAVIATFEFKSMNSTKPCNDFYESVCGDWIHQNDIPDEHERWSKLHQTTRQISNGIEDVLGSSVELLHREAQASVLFSSCKDWDAIISSNPSVPLLMMMRELRRMNEDLSSWPLLDDAYEGLTEFNRLVKAVSQHYESWPFFSITSNVDQEQNNNTLFVIDSPEPLFRELVRENSTEYELKLSFYAKLWALATTGKSLDDGVLWKEVEQVARLEQDIAEILRPTAETGTNALRTNNKFKISQLNEQLSLVDWSDVLLSFSPAYLHDYIRDDPEVIVSDPEYIRELDSVLARYESRTVFNYAWWQYVVDKLLRPTTEFSGTSTEICVDFTSQNLPEAVDSLYLNHIQPQDGNDDGVIDAVFGDIQAAMLAVLDEASWLDERSRERAQEKVASVRFLSGRYFRHRAAQVQTAYSELSLNASETSVMHTRRIDAWQYGRSMALVGKTLEILDVVEDSAIEPNAMYLPSFNIIAFPGLLRYFDLRSPSSSEALYGSLRYVLGHEMVHGFDAQGICYGPDGNALEWMEPTTKKIYEEKLQCVQKRYSSHYLPGSTRVVDGKITLSENVADIDGLKIASKAFDLYRKREGLLPTNKTEFFKAYARYACENMTPEAAQQLYAHDEHAPWKVRVNEALRNNEEFSKAFACSEEARMSSKEKCYVWGEKPSEDAREKNAVNRIAASTLAAVASVLFVVRNYY